jgi:adenosylhomocysteine nucleosidase
MAHSRSFYILLCLGILPLISACGGVQTQGTIQLSTSMASSTSTPTQLPVLIVSGMSLESLEASQSGVISVISNGSASQLRTLLQQYDSTQVRGVISWGIAGGLDPSLNPGDVVLASEVVSGSQSWPTSSQLTGAINGLMVNNQITVHKGIVAGSDTDLTTVSAKASLYASSSAEVVDNESHVAAAFAQAQGLPFAVIRTVADPSSLTLPASVVSGLNSSSGGIDFFTFFSSLATNSSQIPDLILLASDTSAAFSSLGTVHSAVDFSAAVQ